MTDVLFTHSYLLRFDPKEFRAMMPYPPLGTLYAAAVARQHGYTVALFDAMLADQVAEINSFLARHSPAVLVIYDDDFNYLTKMCLTRMREAAFEMSAAAKRHGCRVIVHGSDASDHLAAYFAHGADAVILGEGERTLVETLDWMLRGSGSPSDILGLAYRADNGTMVRTGARDVLRTLDNLPLPARDLIDVARYRALWKSHHGFFSMNMVTTRGCPFHCNWCAKPLYGQTYHSRSPRAVAAEMRELKDTFHPDHIWFCDDIFALTPGWAETFSSEVREAGAMIPFKCLARVDLLLRDSTIDALRSAGCINVWVGAESGSQKILDAMDKGTTVAQIKEASRRLHAAGIRVGFFLQYGYPSETAADIALTLDMLRDCRPDDIGISVSYPLPGTPFYERVKRDMGEKQNWTDSEDLALMFHGTYSPDFYRMLHKVTHKKLRLWQAGDVARAILADPGTLTAKKARRILAGGYHAVTLPSLTRKLRSLERES